MIIILLATYNGEHFLREQLESLLKQTKPIDKIYVYDDASTDSTWQIITKYKELYSDLFVIKQQAKNSGSAKYNFMDMLVNIKADYIMLCDQDDVWLPNKVELTFGKMKELESLWGYDMPILIHTDLIVANEQLKEIAPSVKEMIGTAEINSLSGMILQNNVTGCTAMYNGALSQYLDAKPIFFVMHDWWLALIAVTFGKIGFLKDSTSLYRQHIHNEIGARKVGTIGHLLYKVTHIKEIRQALFNSYKQAGSFLKTYYAKLSEDDRLLLETYSALPSKNKLNRLLTMKKASLFRKGFLRKISQLLFG